MFDLERSILIPHTYHPLPVVWRGEVTGLDCSVTPIVCEANGLFFPGYETEDYQQIAALNAANERETAVETAVRFTRAMSCGAQ